ncbi:hypothetical protein Shyhy02_29110 [Streptomyces hygroscopicus subsp. hygroscopicus]|nr:hypothetical protein Shyhy02_29110 [Streptomyces hygroscopicus subsp. hygroscopicus]
MESAPPEQAASTSGASARGAERRRAEAERAERAGGDAAGEEGPEGPEGPDSSEGEEGEEGADGVGEEEDAAEWATRTSWRTRRTARRIAATAGWGPMSVSHLSFEGVPRGRAWGCELFRHAAYVDGDRSGLFPEHRTPTRRQRSLGRVIKEGVRPFSRVRGGVPVL